jgi:hypothetical protein
MRTFCAVSAPAAAITRSLQLLSVMARSSIVVVKPVVLTSAKSARGRAASTAA